LIEIDPPLAAHVAFETTYCADRAVKSVNFMRRGRGEEGKERGQECTKDIRRWEEEEKRNTVFSARPRKMLLRVTDPKRRAGRGKGEGKSR
jgi:hypothetical protein